MASTEAQKRASMKYMKEKTHPFTMRFSPVDEDQQAGLREEAHPRGHGAETLGDRRLTRRVKEGCVLE